jgi:probable phosphoglycerate mutase
MTQLLLIRHGANDSLKTNKLAGWTPGINLNAEGFAQAQALVARLKGVPIAAIYSSPLERAVQTAEPLAAARGLEIHARERLGETRIGDWTGCDINDLSQTDTWRMYHIHPSGTRPPNGETAQETLARFLAELDSICAAHSKDTVAVFTHADPIKLLIAHYAGAHIDHFHRITVAPASVSVVRLGARGPQVFRVNDTGQMDDLIPQAQ